MSRSIKSLLAARPHQIRPCENCPYRKDAPLKLWHRQEFVDLLEGDASTMGSLYACHKFKGKPPEKRGLCAGWLLDQKKRGVPSIRLRLLLSMGKTHVTEAYKKVTDGGHALFASMVAMCRANGVRRKVKRK